MPPVEDDAPSESGESAGFSSNKPCGSWARNVDRLQSNEKREISKSWPLSKSEPWGASEFEPSPVNFDWEAKKVLQFGG